MSRYPQYTTFQPGELDAALKALRRGVTTPPVPIRAEGEPPSERQARIITTSKTGIILKAECPVAYPDAVEGTMRYERRGPKDHVLHYVHTGRSLADVWYNSEVPQGLLAYRLQFLVEKAWEHATDAYDLAVERERKGYFMRATEDEAGNRRRRKDDALPGITVEMAKVLSGRYAVCQYSQGRLQPRGNPLLDNYETLKEANDAFNKSAAPWLRVCCFNRLDRCWQVPRFNPLYYWPGTAQWEKR